MAGRTVLALVLVLAACRAEEDPGTPADAAVDAGGLTTICEGDCLVTNVRAEFQAVRVFDHAVFGNNADGTLHVEVYAGSDDGCPSETSGTPMYTLVLGKVAPPNGTAPTTASGNVLDFEGDLLGGALGAQATTVIVRAVAAIPSEFVALDIDLEFANGIVDGHLHATHCASLDSV
jgi:hypothetical protein